MKRAWSLLVVLVLAGCSSSKDDPFTADMKMICNAGGDSRDLPREMQTLAALQEIAAKVRTPEAARLMSDMVQAAPSDKAAVLAPALARAGISRCRLLER